MDRFVPRDDAANVIASEARQSTDFLVPPNEAGVPRDDAANVMASEARPSKGLRMSLQTVLQVSGLAKHFGGVRALDGVGFEVPAGQCVALIGPNGAGKSTCFACLAGQQVPTAGEVLWQGQSLLGKPPAERQRLGVARTFQVAQTFEALTVLQNIQLVLRGAAPLAWWDRLDRRQPERALRLAAQAGLQAQANITVADLPYGAKKRLELAMALAGLPEAGADQGAALLLLDEPAAGLALAERADMMALVRQVASQGVTVLYTEHNMDAVFGVADRVLVLMQGRLVADGLPEAVAQDPQVRERYLGMDFDLNANVNAKVNADAKGLRDAQG
jgi:branched-chain amino acid transport system ATP-binding protein